MRVSGELEGPVKERICNQHCMRTVSIRITHWRSVRKSVVLFLYTLYLYYKIFCPKFVLSLTSDLAEHFFQWGALSLSQTVSELSHCATSEQHFRICELQWILDHEQGN